MNIDTRVIKNFLSNEEIEIIEKHVMATDDVYHNYNPGKKPGEDVFSGTYYIFQYYDEKNKLVKDILQPKLEQVFGPQLEIQQIHIFDCFDPYNVHSDVDSGGNIRPTAPNPAWTLIIPLFEVDSHTIVFKEGSSIKQPQPYMAEHPAYNEPTIDKETHLKYFSHIPYHWFNWLTIEEIFSWHKGDLFAADRFKFHTSDNFLANGVKNKRALIAWTSLPD